MEQIKDASSQERPSGGKNPETYGLVRNDEINMTLHLIRCSYPVETFIRFISFSWLQDFAFIYLYCYFNVFIEELGLAPLIMFS